MKRGAKTDYMMTALFADRGTSYQFLRRLSIYYGEEDRMAQILLTNLDEWIKMQKRMLEAFKQLNEEISAGGDRLQIVLATRAVFQHMIKTLRAFDQWLQDPIILSSLDKASLDQVWKAAYDIAVRLLELDIAHTSSFRELAATMIREGKMTPLMALRLGSPQTGEEERERRPIVTM